MTEQPYAPPHLQQPVYGPPAPVKQKMQKRTWMIPVGVFFLGVVVGTGGDEGNSPQVQPVAAAVAPAPAPTVTVTAEAKTVSSPECREALDLADKGFTLAGEGFTQVSEVMGAVSRLDAEGVAEGNRKMSATAGGLRGVMSPYKAAALLCRAS